MGNKHGGKTGPKTYEDIHTVHRHKRGVPSAGEGSDVDTFPHPFSRTHSRSFSVHTARTQRAYLGSLTCPANAGTGYCDDYVSVKKTFGSDDRWLPSDLFVSHVIGDVKRADAYVSCSHDTTLFPSPDARRGILKSPRIHERKELCLDLVSTVPVGDDFAYHSARCSDRLRKMEQSASASVSTTTTRPVRYDIVGSAQLQRKACSARTQCGTVSDGHCSPEHGRRDMLPYEARTRQSVVRKLSAPCQSSSYRKDSESRKRVLLQEEARSKSAHNSPVITRKALPSHGSLVIVKRTPSRGPSVERRFPVNASQSYVLAGMGGESSDSSDVSSSRHHSSSLFGRTQGRSVCDRASKQQTLTASPTLSSRSPQTFRKISDSPVLFLTEKDPSSPASERHHRDRTGRDGKTPKERNRFQISTEESRTGMTKSSTTSSPSKSPVRTSGWEGSPVQAPFRTGSSIPCQVSSQPRGSSVKYYTIPSASSAAELEESQASTLKSSSSAVDRTTGRVQRERTSCSEGEKKKCREKNTEDLTKDPGEVVTEDTIRENTQNAVFGSISPKLKRLRHSSGHRLRCHSTSSSSSSAPSRHPCSDRVPSICPLTSGTTTQNNSCSTSASTIRTVPSDSISNKDYTVIPCDTRFEPQPCVSKSLPSQSFLSTHCPNIDSDIFSESRAKNLGQRIRDVINQSSSGKTTKDDMISSWADTERTRHDVTDDSHTQRWASSQRYHRHYTLPSTELSTQKPCGIHNTFSQRRTQRTGVDKERCTFNTPMQFESKEQEYLLSDKKDNVRDSKSDCSADTFRSDLSKESETFQFQSNLRRKQLYDSTEMVLDDMNRSYDERRLSEYGFLGPPKGLVTSDTTDTFSTDRDTSASSKRESSTSTATDDTLTSFKTRSTADSMDLEETFVLKESLVFVRTDHEAGEGGCVVGSVSGQTVKRQNCPNAAPADSGSAGRFLSHKPRKKRRRKMAEYDDVNSSTDNLDRVPKRVYDRTNVFSADLSDDSDLLTTEEDVRHDEAAQKKHTFLRMQQQKPISECVLRQDSGRYVTPWSANRDVRSSDSSHDGSYHLVHKGRASSPTVHTTARTFPETGRSSDQEDTDLTTTLDELEEDSDDRPDSLTVFPTPPNHSRRRHSPASPRSTDLDYDLDDDDVVSTDLTRSDIDCDNDNPTFSFDPDKENERKVTKGKVLVYEQSCSEDHSNKVVFPCTIYNSTYNND